MVAHVIAFVQVYLNKAKMSTKQELKKLPKIFRGQNFQIMSVVEFASKSLVGTSKKKLKSQAG